MRKEHQLLFSSKRKILNFRLEPIILRILTSLKSNLTSSNLSNQIPKMTITQWDCSVPSGYLWRRRSGTQPHWQWSTPNSKSQAQGSTDWALIFPIKAESPPWDNWETWPTRLSSFQPDWFRSSCSMLGQIQILQQSRDIKSKPHQVTSWRKSKSLHRPVSDFIWLQVLKTKRRCLRSEILSRTAKTWSTSLSSLKAARIRHARPPRLFCSKQRSKRQWSEKSLLPRCQAKTWSFLANSTQARQIWLRESLVKDKKRGKFLCFQTFSWLAYAIQVWSPELRSSI